MPSVDVAPSPEDPLVRNPSVWLIVPTLCLLLGQALAAAPIVIPLSSWSVFFLPFPFLLWRGKRISALLFLLAAGMLLLGYFRHYRILHPAFPADHLRSVINEGTQLYVEGILHQEPERLPQRNRWIMRSQRIWHPTGAQEIQGDLLINVRHTKREWRYGDRIRLWVRPGIPRSSGNPGSFDYASFLASRQIYVTGFLENDEGVELLARGLPGLWNSIEYLRREMRRFIESHFSQDNGALMMALVMGDMGSISKEIRGEFTAAGVNHVLSISGLHVGMLGLVSPSGMVETPRL